MTLQRVPVPASLPKPEGDPDAMEIMSGLCKASGGQLLDACGDAENSLSTMLYVSPKANKMRSTVSTKSREQSQIAHALQAFAKNLHDGAVQLRLDIKAYKAREEQIAHANAYNDLVDQKNKQAPTLGIPTLPGL